MKKLRLMRVAFEEKINPWEITRFRGAVVRTVGLQNEWYHNHKNGGQTDLDNPTKRIYHYRYPLVQYKLNGSNPMIVFVDHGVEEAYDFFSKQTSEVMLNGQPYALKVREIKVEQFNMRVWEREFNYKLYRWQALNEENYRKWQSIEGLAERVAFLENLLIGNIVGFAKGIDWQIEEPLKLCITDIVQEKLIRFKRVKVLCFDLKFRTNVFLPEFVGLGKGVSKGFGMVRTSKRKRI